MALTQTFKELVDSIYKAYRAFQELRPLHEDEAPKKKRKQQREDQGECDLPQELVSFGEHVDEIISQLQNAAEIAEGAAKLVEDRKWKQALPELCHVHELSLGIAHDFTANIHSYSKLTALEEVADGDERVAAYVADIIAALSSDVPSPEALRCVPALEQMASLILRCWIEVSEHFAGVEPADPAEPNDPVDPRPPRPPRFGRRPRSGQPVNPVLTH